MRTEKRLLLALLIIAITGVAASVLMHWITAVGSGVSADSVTYIETARSLLAGHGFSALGKPVTHFPPIYPLLLATVGIFQHGDILQASRWLCTFLFGANVALLGLAVLIGTKGSLLASIITMGIFLTSAPIISVHTMAWSEPPFIFFSLATFVLLTLYLTRRNLYLLLLSSLCAGFAIATRYIGVTLLAPIVIALLCLGNRPMKQKISEIFLAITVTFIPLAAWLLRNRIITGKATDRRFVIHLFDLSQAKQLINTLYGFVIPISNTFSTKVKALQIGIVVTFLLVSLIILLIKTDLRQNSNTIYIIIPVLSIILFFSYIFFLVISISSFDALTPLDTRILSPAFLVICLAIVTLFWSLSTRFNKKVLWYCFVLLMFLPIKINSDKAVVIMNYFHKNGSGYTARQWKDSMTMASVKSLPKSLKIYTNGGDVILFLLQRNVTSIPAKMDAMTQKPFDGYKKQVQVLCNEVGEGKAIVVYLYAIWWRTYQPNNEELERECAMPVLARFDDGIVYGR